MNGREEAIEKMREVADDLEKKFVDEQKNLFIENFQEYLNETTVFLIAKGHSPRYMQLRVDEDSEMKKLFDKLYGEYGYPGFDTQLGKYKVWVHTTHRVLHIRVAPFPETTHGNLISFVKAHVPQINVCSMEKRLEEHVENSLGHAEKAQEIRVILREVLGKKYKH